MIARDRPFPADPDAVEAALDDLVAGRPYDATCLIQISPEQVLRNRAKMTLALSRYGRIAPDYWHGRDLAEMRLMFDLLVDLLAKEGSTTEDR